MPFYSCPVPVLLAAVLLTSALSATAQVATPSPFLNIQPVENQPATVAPLPAAPELEKPLADIAVDVSRYNIEGVGQQHAKKLAQLLTPYTGQQKSFEDLSNAAQQVSAYLQRELGLYLAYAYLPAQDVKEGVVRIRALPGILESVEVVWPAAALQVDREVVMAHLNRLVPGTSIQVTEVERIVFLLNDLRGIRMSFAIKPGTQPGQAVLVATPVNERSLTGNLAVDANGSRYAGAYRGSTTLTWESPFGLGDSLSVSQLQSNTGGLDFTLLGYTLPVGADGLKLGVNLSAVSYELNEQDFPLGLNGQAKSLGLFALYPLVRSRNLNMFALAGYDHKQFTDRQNLAGLETEKEVDSFRLGLSGDFRDPWVGGGLSFYQISLEDSKVHYPAGVPFGLDDDLSASRLVYSFGRLQALIPDHLMLWSFLRGQHALSNLDSSEQCSLGGAAAVRAFAQGETTGDSCSLFTLELRYLPALQWIGTSTREWSVNLFYDQGRVEFRKDTAARPLGFDNHDELAGYGLGLAWDKPDVFTFNISLAWELAGQRKSDPKPETPRVFASYVYYF